VANERCSRDESSRIPANRKSTILDTILTSCVGPNHPLYMDKMCVVVLRRVRDQSSNNIHFYSRFSIYINLKMNIIEFITFSSTQTLIRSRATDICILKKVLGYWSRSLKYLRARTLPRLAITRPGSPEKTFK